MKANPLLINILVEGLKLLAEVIAFIVILYIIGALSLSAYEQLVSLNTHQHTPSCHKYSHP